MDVVQFSRLQFGLTAMYHFPFVPLTLGLSVLLAIVRRTVLLRLEPSFARRSSRLHDPARAGREPLGLWILIANGWMQNPVGARFNIATTRMEVSDTSRQIAARCVVPLRRRA
jgi:cytochrome bd-type quinol oxidase subunit 1